MTKEQTKELNNYHQISITDLVDDCELELENGLKLRFIGQIDIRNMAYDLTWLIEVVERIAKTY